MFEAAQLTPRQKAWFRSVGEGLERETGRTLEEWAALARACPETRPRARLAWMKQTYGLGQNRASLVLNAAFPPPAASEAPKELWGETTARALLERVHAIATALPDVVVGERKSFTAFSRNVQFAAVRPAGSALIVGLALPPEEGLPPSTRASWSERLTSQVRIERRDAIDAIAPLLRRAWERS